MTINQNLDDLEIKINSAKQTLVINLNNKGVSDITTANTLTELANSVNNVTGGGGRDWKEIGYEKEPAYITDGFDYAKKMIVRYDDAKKTNRFRNLFSNDQKVTFIPKFELVEGQSYDNFLAGCQNAQYMEMLDFKGISQARTILSNCKKLQDIKICNTENIIDNGIFRGCDSCKSITKFSVNSMSIFSNSFPPLVQDMTIKDLGSSKLRIPTLNFSNNTEWGRNTEDYPFAALSVRDTFSNIVDRKSLQLSTVNVVLSPITISVLPQDVRKLMEMRGYTINGITPSQIDTNYTAILSKNSYAGELQLITNNNNSIINIPFERQFNDNFAYYLPQNIELSQVVGIIIPSSVDKITLLPKLKYERLDMMFEKSSLGIIDISSIDTTNVTNCTHMYSYSNAHTIDMSNFNSQNITQYDGMFECNRKLATIKLLHCSAETIQFIKDRIAEAKNDPQQPITQQITLVTDAGEEVI